MHSLFANNNEIPKIRKSHETNEEKHAKHSIVTWPMPKMHTSWHYIASTFKSPHDMKNVREKFKSHAQHVRHKLTTRQIVKNTKHNAQTDNWEKRKS